MVKETMVLFVAAFVLLFVAIPEGRAQVEWRDISKNMENILEDREESEWGDAGQFTSETARTRRIQRIMSDAIGILSDDPASETLGRIEEIRAEILSKRDRIGELKMDSLNAPREFRLEGNIFEMIAALFTWTKADYEDAIADEEARIAALESERQQIKSELAAELSGLGINLRADQIDALLSTVTVEQIVEMYSVYENLRSINNELSTVIEASGENIDIAKRYYGLYAVLMETALFMHDEFMNDMRRYYRQLDEIVRETDVLATQSRSLLSAARDSESRRILEANLQSQSLTVRAANRYKEYLSDQFDMVAMKRNDLGRKLQLAVNTYKTVMVSSRLLDLMRIQSRDFNALMSLEVPSLRPFESIEMQREFERLSERLQAQS